MDFSPTGEAEQKDFIQTIRDFREMRFSSAQPTELSNILQEKGCKYAITGG
jgi:hypothetical protein